MLEEYRVVFDDDTDDYNNLNDVLNFVRLDFNTKL